MNLLKILTTVLGVGKRVIVGAIDPVGAVKKGVQQVLLENKESEPGGVGKFDYARLSGLLFSVVFTGLIILYLSGVITEDVFTKLIELIKPFILVP